jgi:alpha-galactosidase
VIENDLVPKFGNERDRWFDYGRTGGYLRNCVRRAEEAAQEYRELLEGVRELPSQRSHEYGVYIIEAMETNRATRVNGNVPNWGLIDNLPVGCCVEVPCLVDANGVQPVNVGSLPTQLAAMNRCSVNVQELTVEAALSGSTDAVHQAVMMDPLTAAVCTLPQIHAMVEEMLEAQAEWLPEFE